MRLIVFLISSSPPMSSKVTRDPALELDRRRGRVRGRAGDAHDRLHAERGVDVALEVGHAVDLTRLAGAVGEPGREHDVTRLKRGAAGLDQAVARQQLLLGERAVLRRGGRVLIRLVERGREEQAELVVVGAELERPAQRVDPVSGHSASVCRRRSSGGPNQLSTTITSQTATTAIRSELSLSTPSAEMSVK